MRLLRSALIAAALCAGCGDDSSPRDEAEPAPISPAPGDASAADARAPVRDAAAAVVPDAAAPTSGGPTDAGPADAGRADAAVDAGKSDASVVSGALSYESFGKPFMETYCTTCHNAAVMDPESMPVFESLAQIKSWKDQIRAEAVTSTRMPNAPKRPSAAERKQLGQWLDSGPN